MQTFLPYPDYVKSAASLDRARLGKQRLECRQIMRAALGSSGWSSHPATLMWRQHLQALARYCLAIDDEWIARGYVHTMEPLRLAGRVVDPWWLGDERFHLSHKRALIFKMPEHYQRQWPQIKGRLEYVWPQEFKP